MTDAYQNRIPTAVPGFDMVRFGSGSFHDCNWASLPA